MECMLCLTNVSRKIITWVTLIWLVANWHCFSFILVILVLQQRFGLMTPNYSVWYVCWWLRFFVLLMIETKKGRWISSTYKGTRDRKRSSQSKNKMKSMKGYSITWKKEETLWSMFLNIFPSQWVNGKKGNKILWKKQQKPFG